FQELETYLPDWREKRILDAGCGTGAILKHLGNPERNIGIDLAPEAISLCRERGLDNVVQGDISALPFENGSFDAVICSSVLYHAWVPNIPGALQEFHRVIRPAGLLLINVPAFPFLHSAHDDAVMTARRFKKKEIKVLLENENFEICRLTYWTTFVFPLAVAARTLGGSKMGRDFETAEMSFAQRVLAKIMRVELSL